VLFNLRERWFVQRVQDIPEVVRIFELRKNKRRAVCASDKRVAALLTDASQQGPMGARPIPAVSLFAPSHAHKPTVTRSGGSGCLTLPPLRVPFLAAALSR
jgi:hypothetical protein